MIRKTISVIMILIIAFSFCGCSKNVELDDEFAEVAELILSEYSDYIVLNHAPEIDDENQLFLGRSVFAESISGTRKEYMRRILMT